MAVTRQVNLKLFAETAKAQADLDAIMNEAVALSKLNPTIKPQIEKAAALRQMAVLRGELKAAGDKAGQDLGTGISDGTKKGLGSRGGGSWIAAAIGLGAPLTGPLAAGGLAFAAFGGLAAKSLVPVVKAMSGPGGLAAGWQTLNARQKTAAAGVQALETRYAGLSKSMEPRSFQVFNTLLSTANGLLGPSAKLASASGGAVERFLVQFENDAGLRQFIGYASTVAPQAIGLLGTDVTTLVHTILTLAQAAGGTGLFELRLLTSGLQILDKVVSVLPGPLEGAALGVSGLVLGLSKLGVLVPLLRLSGLAGAMTAARAAMAATAVEADAAAVATAALGGAEVSTAAETGVLAAAVTALDEVNPFVWVAAAVAGLGALGFWLSKTKTAADKQVSSIETLSHAQGFNTAGYFAAAKAIGQANAQQEKQKTTLVNLHTGMVTGTVAVGDLTGATQTLTDAQQKNLTAGQNQNSFLDTLETKYGITRKAAITLATQAGVLAKQVNKGGQSMKDAVTQTEALGASMLSANDPAKTMNADLYVMGTDAARAASGIGKTNTAWDTFLSQSTAVETAELGVISGMRQLAKDASKAGTSFTGVSNKSIALQSEFEGLVPGLQNVIDTLRGAHAPVSALATVISTDFKKAVDSGALANKGMRQQIFDMATEAGYTGPNKIRPLTAFIDKNAASTRTALGLTDKWSAALGRIPKNERTNITVHGHGTFSVGTTGLKGAARGMFIGTGRPGVDDQLILAQRNELVVPAPIVKSGAVDHLRGRIPGFAQGGVVGSYSDGVGGLSKWLASENAATLRAIESATAAATLRGIRSARAASSFGAAGPGGGAPAANAALARAMFPGENFAAWNYVAMRESGWNNKALNRASGAYGIGQALPPTKMPFAAQAIGGSNPAAQIGWMEGYMQSRYGGAAGAAAHERAFNWYGTGTKGAAPGWAVVGERGWELARMHGGEQVLSHSQSVQAGMGGLPGLASGTGSAALSSRQSAGLSLLSYFRNPGSNPSIRSEEAKYLHDIARYFDGSSAKWRDAEVRRQTGRLLDLGTKLGSINSKISSARSYQQSVRQGLSGYADLSGMTLGGAMAGGGKQSGARYLLTQERGQEKNLKKFAGVLRKLSDAKVDGSLIRQVVALGPDDGTQFGLEILAGGPKLIRALNSTESAIGKTETAISRGAASAVYEGRYQPGKHFLHELAKDRAGLEKLFQGLGRKLGEEAARWFRVPKGRRPKGFAGGGLLTEPVYGYGMSGQPYTFAEHGPERITPGAGVMTTRHGPLLHIEHLHVREEADLAILSQRLGFLIASSGLG